jgi:hypothetical protein
MQSGLKNAILTFLNSIPIWFESFTITKLNPAIAKIYFTLSYMIFTQPMLIFHSVLINRIIAGVNCV